MEIEHSIINNILIMTLQAETLDAKNSAQFKENALDIIDKEKINQVVFDLKKLQLINTSGLSSLLSILRTLNQQGGDLKLAEISKPIEKVFELVALDRIFETYDSKEEAINSF